MKTAHDKAFEQEQYLKSLFHQKFGAGTLQSEQELAASQPLHLDNYLQRGLRLYSNAFHQNGNLEEEFQSASGRVFQIPSYLVPLSLHPKYLTLCDAETEDTAFLFETIGNERFVRAFFHPAELDRIRSGLSGFRPDTRRWFGSPSSSNRSLFVIDPDRPDLPPLVLKLSLGRTLMGFTRVIRARHVARSVLITHILRDAHRESQGRLRGGGRWCFLPEVFGLLPPEMEESGCIARRFPKLFDGSRQIWIPYYALLSGRIGERWFDQLARASGEKPADFLWTRIAEPLLDLFHLLALDYGISAELHKQNVGLVIDAPSRTIESLYLRDMDGLAIDLPYRTFLGLPDPPVGPEWGRELDDVLRSDAAQLTQAFNYFFLGTMNLDQLAKGILRGYEVYAMLRRADERHVAEINRRFHAGLRSASGISRFWDDFHRSITSPADFTRVPTKRRRYVRCYGHLRQLELRLGGSLHRFFHNPGVGV